MFFVKVVKKLASYKYKRFRIYSIDNSHGKKSHDGFKRAYLKKGTPEVIFNHELEENNMCPSVIFEKKGTQKIPYSLKTRTSILGQD